MSIEQFSPRKIEDAAERLLEHPPRLILVFDNWRGTKPMEKLDSEKTIDARAAVASYVYHSTLYPSDAERPLIVCFAGKHNADLGDPRGSMAGSKKVANALSRFGIPSEKIVTRENTITTVTDLIELDAFARAHSIDNILIVTTDDHVKRTKLEVKNHFRRRGRKKWCPHIEVIGPSSRVLDKVSLPENMLFTKVEDRTKEFIAIGRSALPDGGLNELIATTIARFPVRKLRRVVQKRAEARTHNYTPTDLDRIQRAAEAMMRSGRK